MRLAVSLLLVSACGLYADSPPADLVSTSVEPPGASCAAGGVAVSSGHDDNGDGVLEPTEVEQTTFLCTTPGQLVRVVAEPPGANCAYGGDAIETGTDANGNGVLDDSEVASTTYECTAAPAPQTLIALAAEPPGANCAHGGTAVHAGVDVDGDGVLEASEVTSTSFVCVPPSQLQELVRVTPTAPGVCPTVGQAVLVGFDLDGDGALDDDEVTSITNVCGGVTTVVRVESEPAGANCDAGGEAIRTGIDDNGDGVLEDVEVDSTSFVCRPATTIEGDVIIHHPADLDVLAGVTTVHGSIYVQSIDVTAIDLPDLEAVHGIGCSSDPCPVTSVSLPNLQSGVVAFGTDVEVLDLPSLVTGGFFVGYNTAFAGAPRFQTGDVSVNSHLVTTLDLPEYRSGRLTLGAGALSTISVPLFEGPHLEVYFTWVDTLAFPSFESGYIDLHNNETQTISLPALTHADYFDVFNNDVHTLEVPSLVSVTGSFNVGQNQHLASCFVLQLWARLGYPANAQIGGNDDTATCP